ncbi:hypothetical protein [Corynebacterium sp. A21]|uniref:hypothetical protein n=1 Tax=Corynebacterium sp. A21 TaxID=3457318 RepID=UPI003FD5BF39
MNGLWWVEDSFGEERAKLIEVGVDLGARVFEISGESSWVWLYRSYPLEVARDRCHAW